ncbi:MAG: arylsulfate sulfotransferase [Myxococcota bacterium]|jgi:arylsulfate sulfotransferase
MLLWLLLACGPDDRTKPATADSAMVGSQLSWVQLPEAHRRADVWFARELILAVDRAAVVDVDLEAGGERVTWQFDVSAGEQSLALVGLFPDATFVGTVRATHGVETITAPLEITTGPVPDDYPLLEALVHEPARMSPGWTFLPFDGIAWGKYFAALDEQLRPRWMWIPPNPVTEGRVHDGVVWWIGGGAIQGHTLLGDRVARYAHWENSAGSIVVEDVRSFHHEAHPLDDGFLTLSTSLVHEPDFPNRSLTGRRPATLLSTTIVDLASDGTVRAQVDLADVLDTTRVGWTSFELVTREEGEVLDWSHANAVIPTPDDAWIVSVRHQDALVKLDATGRIHWILGTHDGWRAPWSDALLEPVGELDWPYHPHAPELLPDGGILVFDNHNYGSTPYDPPIDRPPPQRSRVTVYDVDEEAGTVRQRWTFDELTDGPVFAFALGDADHLDNGDVLAVWGWVESEQDVAYTSMGRGIRGARIVEFEPGAASPLVLDLRMTSPVYDVQPVGWSAYRAQRVERLHPALMSWSTPAR